MSFEIDTDYFDPEEVGGSGFVAGGYYHAIVEGVDEESDSKGDMLVDLSIQNGTTPGQVGKHFQLRLKKEFDKWPMRKMASFAIAARLITIEAIKASKAGTGPKVSPDYSKAVGRSICLHLERKPGNDGREWTNLVYDNIWVPEDKRASHIPLHPDIVKREGIVLPANRPVDGVLSGPPAKPTSNSTKSDTKKPPTDAGASPDLSSVL